MKSLHQLPSEMIFLILSHLNISNTLLLIQTCKGLQNQILAWNGWRHIKLFRSLNLSSKEIEMINNRLFLLLKRTTIPLLSFDVNGVSHFDDDDLNLLEEFTPTLVSVDLRNASRLSERALACFFSASCPDCPICQPSHSHVALKDAKHLKPLKELNLSNLPSLTDSILGLIGERCSHLEKLDIGQLRDYRFSEEGIRAFCVVWSHSKR
jgi:hypothetical protein